MLIVAGTTLKQLEPRVWDVNSPYYLPNLRAIMVSFAEFQNATTLRHKAEQDGLHSALGVPANIRVYLDNGAFSCIKNGKKLDTRAYWKFVNKVKPDWYPIPADFIPMPDMTSDEQLDCFKKTMYYNRRYSFDGCIPVVHAGTKLEKYLSAFQANTNLREKNELALGGLVPQLLQTKGTEPKTQAVDSIIQVRQSFKGKIHVFGIGGTATLHLAVILGLDSVDSSGWRNRAARGIIQLPGRGDRLLTQFGTWRGRKLDKNELEILAACQCPGCLESGIKGLKASGAVGFYRRATHNLHVLLTELENIESQIRDNTYENWYTSHVFNSFFLKLIEYALLHRSNPKRVRISDHKINA
jgi:7-cyano-7-deazaguanine tRNA-ribosyltransferase